MRHIAITMALFVLSASGCANAQPSASMSELPASVREALLGLCAPCEFADSDAPWNSTDVLNGRPQRRLAKTEKTASGWRVEYDHGGRGRHSHVVVFEFEPAIHVAEGSSCLPAVRVDCEW
jgi:hypothetical protein